MLLAYTFATVFWKVLAPEQAAQSSAIKNTAKAQQFAADPDYSGQVAAAHLFGKVELVKQKAEKPVDAPETRLNLKLRGIYAASDEEAGLALIASGSGAEKLYKVGDSLPGNSELASVYPDRVMLRRAGKYETLRLPESENRSGASISVSANKSRSSSNNNKLGLNSEVAKLRKEALKNPAMLAKFVNAVPARKNGQFIGFRIIAKQKHPAFDELDLRSGDIITQVNGIDIDSPQKGFQILQQLRNATSVNVSISRGGQTINVSHSL